MRPGIARRLGALARAPLLHFLVAGAALAALRPEPVPEVVIPATEVERRVSAFRAEAGRAPGAAERDALLEAAAEEEILVRRAWAAGWPGYDEAVTARLRRLGGFLGPEGETSPDEAVRRARELGLDRSDPVIRRYLAERSRLAIAGEADASPPGEAALAAHLARHPDRFAEPERWRLRHVFVSARRGDPAARAAAVGARLAAGARGDEPDLGDPFPRGRDFVATPAALDRVFGPGFAASLDPGAIGRWQGPVGSPLGLHWVWLDPPRPAATPALAEVRTRVLQDLREERRRAHLRARLDALRAGHRVRIGDGGA